MRKDIGSHFFILAAAQNFYSYTLWWRTTSRCPSLSCRLVYEERHPRLLDGAPKAAERRVRDNYPALTNSCDKSMTDFSCPWSSWPAALFTRQVTARRGHWETLQHCLDPAWTRICCRPIKNPARISPTHWWQAPRRPAHHCQLLLMGASAKHPARAPAKFLQPGLKHLLKPQIRCVGWEGD